MKKQLSILFVVSLSAALTLLPMGNAMAACHSASFRGTSVEASESEAQVTLTVDRPNPVPCAGTVEYSTSDGTAKAGVDYERTSGTLNFAEGDDEKTISIPLINDDAVEEAKTFTVTLSRGGGGISSLGGPATVSIEDDDSEAAATESPGEVTTQEDDALETKAGEAEDEGGLPVGVIVGIIAAVVVLGGLIIWRTRKASS